MTKCEKCNKIFEDENRYLTHSKSHLAIEEIQDKFPVILLKDDECIERTEEWYNNFKEIIKIKSVDLFPDCHLKIDPMSYLFGENIIKKFGSIFYNNIIIRLYSICVMCKREWKSPDLATKCKHEKISIFQK